MDRETESLHLSGWDRHLRRAGGADFETENAVVVRDSDGVDLAGDDTDARITADGAKYKLSFVLLKSNRWPSAEKPIIINNKKINKFIIVSYRK